MLGKTNINTLSEGAIVTEVEDYKWIQMESGINGNFIKAIYKSGYLVAITEGGTVAYTTDGEVWKSSQLEYDECKLNDIDWDSNRFIIVGSYKTDEDKKRGLIVTTTDFVTFDKLPDIRYSSNQYSYNEEYSIIFPIENRYLLLSERRVLNTDLTEEYAECTYIGASNTNYPLRECSVEKNSSGIVVYFKFYPNASNYHDYIYKIDNKSSISLENKSSNERNKNYCVFECKDILYCMGLLSEDSYALRQVLSSGEILTMCTGQNFRFVDGVYFNENQIFINDHSMLVVKKRENLADKTVEDLVEIAPEYTMNCITKAFDHIYIFGNQGVILKSSAETNNEGAIAVQALSAKKALAEAKAYTDEQIALIEARIKALETL